MYKFGKNLGGKSRQVAVVHCQSTISLLCWIHRNILYLDNKIVPRVRCHAWTLWHHNSVPSLWLQAAVYYNKGIFTQHCLNLILVLCPTTDWTLVPLDSVSLCRKLRHSAQSVRHKESKRWKIKGTYCQNFDLCILEQARSQTDLRQRFDYASEIDDKRIKPSVAVEFVSTQITNKIDLRSKARFWSCCSKEAPLS